MAELTLVIPTKNRPEFVFRTVEFWSDSPFNLVVADGSPEPIDEASLRSIKENLQYIHLPSGVASRIAAAASIVETHYVALASDDEYYIPSALWSCLEELEKSKCLVACCGRALGFRPGKKQILGIEQYPRLCDYSLMFSTSEERLNYHMRNYSPSLIYAVCRADIWKKAWYEISSLDFPFFASAEIRFSMLLSFAGKSKVLPMLLWLRSHGETQPIRDEASLNPNVSIRDWYCDQTFGSQHRLFLSSMAKALRHCCEGAVVNPQQVERAILEYFAFLDEYYSNRDVKQPSQNPLVATLFHNLFRFIARGSHRGETDLFRAALSLEESNVDVDYLGLEKIYNSLAEFHKIDNGKQGFGIRSQ